MKTIDFLIAIPVIWGIYKGYSKGLISEVTQVGALVLGILLGSSLSYLFADFLINTAGLSEKIVPLLAFIIVFAAVLIGVHFIAKILEKAAKTLSLGWLNTLGGIAFGGLKFLLIIGIVIQLIISNDTKGRIISEDSRENSVLLKPTLAATNFFSPYLKKALFDTDFQYPGKQEELNAEE